MKAKHPVSNFRLPGGAYSPIALKVGKAYERLTKRLLKSHRRHLMQDDIQLIAFESVQMAVIMHRLTEFCGTKLRKL